MWIPNNTRLVIGQKVRLTRDIEVMRGTMKTGTIVTVVDIDDIHPSRGYAFEDKEGNKVIECGWEGWEYLE